MGDISRICPATALGPTQPPIEWVPGISRGVKQPGRGVNHQSPSNDKVKEGVELYIYSPTVPSWQVIGRPLPFYEMESWSWKGGGGIRVSTCPEGLGEKFKEN